MKYDKIQIQFEKIKNVADLRHWIHNLRDYLGISHVMYQNFNVSGSQIGSFTYPVEWVVTYTSKKYQLTDPVVLSAIRKFGPVNWKDVDWSTPESQIIKKDFLSFGLGNQGFSIPIWGPRGDFAIFSINGSADDNFWKLYTENNFHTLKIYSLLIHKKFLEFFEKTEYQKNDIISNREIQTLSCLSRGMTRKESSVHLSISESTLRAYIESAILKLKANNLNHAVFIAVSKGLIKIE